MFFFFPEKSQIAPEKICKFMPEKILKVPEKKYELKNTREKLKKSAREATREKIGKNPFLGHFFFLGEEKKHCSYCQQPSTIFEFQTLPPSPP